jgi:hypothetical protein
MSKKSPEDIHPRSSKGRANRFWQTKHGELCEVLHNIHSYRGVLDGAWAPQNYRDIAERELADLYPQLGRLAFEAGPVAFRECWKKSKDMMGMIKGRSFQARVFDAVETAWLPMSPLFLEFTKDGKAVLHPKVPDFHKSGLRKRARQDLERDPQIKRLLDEPQGEEAFDKAFRRALKDLRLDNLPEARSGPAPAPKKKTRR